MKIVALDIGDVWIGSALSDSLGISAKPYKTVTYKDLVEFISVLIKEEPISTVIVGCPITLSGGQSNQAKKTIDIKEMLEKNYPNLTWILWDERLSSKRADAIRSEKKITKEQKIQSHSIAAAFILQSYLDYKAFYA